MKKAILLALAGLFLGAMIVACGGNANAATLPASFVDDNGQVFQIDTMLSVEKVGATIKVKQPDGYPKFYADASGNVWAKIVASAIVASAYAQVPGANRYLNTKVAWVITCISNQTVFGYATIAEYFPDSCALHAVVRGRAN